MSIKKKSTAGECFPLTTTTSSSSNMHRISKQPALRTYSSTN